MQNKSFLELGYSVFCMDEPNQIEFMLKNRNLISTLKLLNDREILVRAVQKNGLARVRQPQ